MRRAVTSSRLCCIVGLLARSASGATNGSSEVTFRDCAPREAKEIAGLVAIDRVAHTESASGVHAAVTVTCRAGRFDVEVARTHGGVLSRSVDLQETPVTARARFVAIAIAELLAADELDPEPSPAIVVPLPTAAARDASTRGTSSSGPICCRVRLQVVGSARMFGGGETLFGGGLRVALPRDLPLAIDVLAEYGSRALEEGSVSMVSATAGLTYGYTRQVGALSVRGALGGRGGIAVLRGNAGQAPELVAASSVRGWGGPMAQAAVALAERRGVVVELLVEGGYALFPVYAVVSDARQAGLHGVWASASLALGFDR